MRAPRLAGVLSAFAVLAGVPALRGLADGMGTHATVDAAALRHLKLLKSEPAANAAVSAPATVRLWFSQRPELAVTRVTLTGATGAERVLAPLARGRAGDAPIEAPVGIALAPGRYTIAWRTMAKDGHVLNGTIPFTVR